MSQLPYLLISLEILEAGFIGSSLIHEVLLSSELKVLMLCMFFNAVDSCRAMVGVIFKIFSLESKRMGFFCLNHVFHYHLVVLSLRPVLNLSASTWVLDSNSLSFSPLSYLWLSSATLRLSCLLVIGWNRLE